MNKEVLERVDALAAKLNTTAEHLWSVMLAQVRVEILTYCIILAVLLGLMFVMYKLTRWMLVQREQAGSFEQTDYTLGLVFCAFFSLVLLGLALAASAGLLTLLLNPEYWALKQIMESVGGKR